MRAQIGDRVRLTKAAGDYPLSPIPAGETGTLVRIEPSQWPEEAYHAIRLDKHHEQLDEWDNEIWIYEDLDKRPEHAPETYYEKI